MKEEKEEGQLALEAVVQIACSEQIETRRVGNQQRFSLEAALPAREIACSEQAVT